MNKVWEEKKDKNKNIYFIIHRYYIFCLWKRQSVQHKSAVGQRDASKKNGVSNFWGLPNLKRTLPVKLCVSEDWKTVRGTCHKNVTIYTGFTSLIAHSWPRRNSRQCAMTFQTLKTTQQNTTQISLHLSTTFGPSGKRQPYLTCSWSWIADFEGGRLWNRTQLYQITAALEGRLFCTVPQQSDCFMMNNVELFLSKCPPSSSLVYRMRCSCDVVKVCNLAAI